MNANRYYLRQWESRNQQLLFAGLKALQKIVWQAAMLLSFVLYLMYGFSKFGLLLARGLMQGPQLVRRVSPEQFLERHEFEKREMDSYPQLWSK
jgi:hypothetical protein